MLDSVSARINLTVPMDIAIEIERICSKKGISRSQFIKEAINREIKKQKQNAHENELEAPLISKLMEDISEIKKTINDLKYNVVK